MEDAECLLADQGAGWGSDKHYTLRQVASKNVRKFNTTATDYLLSLNPQSEEQPLLEQLVNIFDSLVQEMTSGMPDNDLVRFVLQSNEQVSLQNAMQVHLVHVGIPQGGAASRERKHYGFKLSKFLDSKQSVLRIKKQRFSMSRSRHSNGHCTKRERS